MFNMIAWIMFLILVIVLHCFPQAPASDVVAIGLASGQILLHNLKYDETITKFYQFWGPVTSIAFRTGN